MRLGINTKVVLVSLSMILFFGLALGYYITRYQNHILRLELDERINVLMNNLSLVSEYPLLIEDKEAIVRLTKGILAQKDIVFCRIKDKDGNIYYEEGSNKAGNISEYTVDIVTKIFVDKVEEELMLGTPSLKEERIGKIYLGVSLSGLKQKLNKAKMIIATVIILAIIITSITIYLLLRFILGRPVKQLVRATEKIAEGNLKYKAPILSRDEIGILAASFNRMTKSLQAITVSRDYVDSIIKNMMDSLIVVTKDGRIKTVNKATLNLLGYKEDELLNQPVKIIIEEAGCLFIGPGAEELIKKGFINNVENTYLSKDGRKIPVLFSASAIYNIDNNIEEKICVAKDISERKQAEKQLLEKAKEIEKVNKELNDFVYIVSHDLKEPLFAIEGFTSRLSRAYENMFDEKGKRYMDRIKVNIGTMSQRIYDIMDVIKVGTVEYNFNDNNSMDIVKDVVSELESKITNNKVKVTIHDNLPTVLCDEKKMRNVFLNLISNAIKYMGDNGQRQVRIGCEKNGDYYRFFVEDTGIGIQEEYQEQIFKIFRRLKDVEVEGTGVGLAIVKKIIELHKGKVWIESPVKDGRGARFWFTLPMAIT